MLSEVVQDWPLHQLDYQQSQRLFGTPVDVTRGCSTYIENVNSARYMKQSVENVVLFMDIIKDGEICFLGSISVHGPMKLG